jgi:AcrR family transcriptional regulator
MDLAIGVERQQMRFQRVLPQQLELSAISRAALACFAETGYHGTTTRQIARAANLSVPGVYHHYPSKHDILVDISETAMKTLIASAQQALSQAGQDLIDRFDALVECLVQFHTDFADVAFVSFSEIRSLEPEARAHHLEQRRQVQEMITSLVEEGARSGEFGTADPRAVGRAITSICLGISQWYHSGHGVSVESLTDTHVQICHDTVAWIGASRT